MPTSAHQLDGPSLAKGFEVSTPARLQVARLTPFERKRLATLLAAADQSDDTQTRRTEKGRFITRISSSKRVLWEPHDGMPRILSIVDRTYKSK